MDIGSSKSLDWILLKSNNNFKFQSNDCFQKTIINKTLFFLYFFWNLDFTYLNTKIANVKNGYVENFWKFFIAFKDNNWQNRKTCQIKYQIDTICYQMVTREKIIRALLLREKVVPDKIKNSSF